ITPAMTENFSNIEDEPFPSFFGESISSNISEALNNCTLASSLGLPVAASTVAKVRPDFAWPADAQESYLETERIVQENGNHLAESGKQPNGKYILSFKDDLEHSNNTIGITGVEPHPPNTDLPGKKLLAPEKPSSMGIIKDISNSVCVIPHSNLNEKASNAVHISSESVKESQHLLKDDLSRSVTSFLENERLMSIASLDGSFSDELDDEEFYDDQLEAYFKKLLPPGMHRGVIEGQEISDPRRDSYMDQFQMLHVRLAATGMDSAPASEDEDVEQELEKAAMHRLHREPFITGDQSRPSFRPGLEGGSSEDDSKEIHSAPSNAHEFSCRESAEGHVLCSPMLAIGSDTSEVGDGSNGSNDGMKNLQTQTEQPFTWDADSLTRNVAGEENVNFLEPPLCQQVEDRIDPVGKGAISVESKTTSLPDRKRMLNHNTMLDSRDCNAAPQDLTTKNKSSLPSNVEVQERLPDEYLSPSYQKECEDFSTVLQSAVGQQFSWSFCSGKNETDCISTPHSVVYQNEEGKWVTDLAYYKPFDCEQIENVSGVVCSVKDEDFVVGSDAIAMIQEDQEEFEKEHRFIQEEKMDLENSSVNIGDTSWKAPPNANILLKASHLSSGDASYLRLSLGEFFGQRSEALGCLGEGPDVKR
ncbi:hypothetical protein GDO86_011144, partial [Hymenochirus boettgeri]